MPTTVHDDIGDSDRILHAAVCVIRVSYKLTASSCKAMNCDAGRHDTHKLTRWNLNDVDCEGCLGAQTNELEP